MAERDSGISASTSLGMPPVLSKSASWEVGSQASLHSSGSSRPSKSASGGGVDGDLPAGVCPHWCCPACKRDRLQSNRNPKTRKGKLLVFHKPLDEFSWCLSCHNYSRGSCKGEVKSDITRTLNGSTGAQQQWNKGIDDYEDALETSAGGRVTKMSERFPAPTIIKAVKKSTHDAQMMLPNFWPEDVYVRAKQHPVPEEAGEVQLQRHRVCRHILGPCGAFAGRRCDHLERQREHRCCEGAGGCQLQPSLSKGRDEENVV